MIPLPRPRNGLPRLAAGVVLALALGAAADPAPQSLTPTLTVFAEHFYRGKAIAFGQDEGDIRLEFPPGSVKAQGRWLVCSEPRFKGRCIELENDYPVEASLGLNFRVRSLRGVQLGAGAGRPAPGMVPGGPSLAGSSARFFASPNYGSERALACPDGAASMSCAKRTAEDLCRRAGYRAAEHFTLQSERGLYYLADVLCTKP